MRGCVIPRTTASPGTGAGFYLQQYFHSGGLFWDNEKFISGRISAELKILCCLVYISIDKVLYGHACWGVILERGVGQGVTRKSRQPSLPHD